MEIYGGLCAIGLFVDVVNVFMFVFIVIKKKNHQNSRGVDPKSLTATKHSGENVIVYCQQLSEQIQIPLVQKMANTTP